MKRPGFDDPEEEEEEWDDEGEFDEGLSSTAAASRCTSRRGPGAVGDRSMSVMAKLLSRSNASGWNPYRTPMNSKFSGASRWKS